MTALSGRLGGEVVLVTGFPGERARALVELLVEREPDAQLWLLVSSGRLEEARDFLDARGGAGRVRVIEGEGCAIDFGLGRLEYAELCDRVERCFFVYQTLSPDVPRELATRVNLGGARELVEFAKAAQRLRAGVYLSSSAVFGGYRGEADESAFDVGQVFSSDAESSLARAEALLRRSAALPLTVVRVPPLVSRSGSWESRPARLTSALELLAGAPSDLPLPLPPGADRVAQLAALEFAVEALYAVVALGAHAGPYHFVDPGAPRWSEVLEYAATRLGKTLEPAFDARQVGRLFLKNPGFWLTGPSSRALARWSEGEVMLKSERGQALLEAAEVTAPPFTSYLDAVLHDLETRDASRWRAQPARLREPADTLS